MSARDGNGLPILGPSAPELEPVPRALLLVDATGNRVLPGPGAVEVPVPPRGVAAARVVGDAGEVALWRSLFLMIDTVARELRELRGALAAAGVIAPGGERSGPGPPA